MDNITNSPESKERMSKAQKNKRKTGEVKSKISETNRRNDRIKKDKNNG